MAVLDDDELISADIDRHGKPKPTRTPPAKGWGTIRDDLADLKDLIRVLQATVARSDKPITPTPRPETAYDRYEARERRQNTNWLNEKLGI